MADDAFDRRQDFNRGLGRGESIFIGQTGRLKEDKNIQDILQRRKDQLEGFTPQEQEQFRSATQQGLNRSQAGNLRQLAAQQAAAGVRGGVAAQQAGNILEQGQRERIGAEQNLQLQNIGEKRRALGAFEQSATDVAKFDIGQASREKFGALATALAEQGFGVAERSADKASQVASAQAAAATGGGGKK